jgi:hypothetical protein
VRDAASSVRDTTSRVRVVRGVVRVTSFDRRDGVKLVCGMTKAVRRDRSSVHRAMSFMCSGQSCPERMNRVMRVVSAFVHAKGNRMRDATASVHVASVLVHVRIAFVHVAIAFVHVAIAFVHVGIALVRVASRFMHPVRSSVHVATPAVRVASCAQGQRAQR